LEIDEILALRVLTLTDEEKAEARGTDPRAAGILDRVDAMPPEVWSRLHGAIRSLQPAADEPALDEMAPWWTEEIDGAADPMRDTTWVAGIKIGRGAKVRLRPGHRADAHDMFLDGQLATVARVYQDVDGNDHLAVTIDDDPAAEVMELQRRFFYFHPDEVELIDPGNPGAMPPRILVAGIGNIFFGDDGFGVEVANRLKDVAMPDGVELTEFGIRGVHLAYQLLDGYDALVLIDALPMGEPPGTVAVIEVAPEDYAPTAESMGDDIAPTMDAHTMNPAIVLQMLASLDGKVGRVLVIGCQPHTIDERIGLSDVVAEAVDKAVEQFTDVIGDLVADLSSREEETCP
jgi:hydrogenase maturation protease